MSSPKKTPDTIARLEAELVLVQRSMLSALARIESLKERERELIAEIRAEARSARFTLGPMKKLGRGL